MVRAAADTDRAVLRESRVLDVFDATEGEIAALAGERGQCLKQNLILF
jgi:hypothetical protein